MSDHERVPYDVLRELVLELFLRRKAARKDRPSTATIRRHLQDQGVTVGRIRIDRTVELLDVEGRLPDLPPRPIRARVGAIRRRRILELAALEERRQRRTTLGRRAIERLVEDHMGREKRIHESK